VKLHNAKQRPSKLQTAVPPKASQQKQTRRNTFAFSLLSLSTLIAPANTPAAPSPYIDDPSSTPDLKWTTSPLNVRSKTSLFDTEITYSVRFITYLSRFLLSFDPECQRWWYTQAGAIPRLASSEEVAAIRLRQFGSFSASVEVGLREYNTAEGPERLMTDLLRRYCDTPRDASGETDWSDKSDKVQRERKEARRQIALLFGLMNKYQPTEKITEVLAAIDNATVSSVEIYDGGSGYAPGYGAPNVVFDPPQAGPSYQTAMGIAVMQSSGRILRIDLKDRGNGYKNAPEVFIAEPLAMSTPKSNITSFAFLKNATEQSSLDLSQYQNPLANATTLRGAKAKAFVNKGVLERIDIVDAGFGYGEDEDIKIRIEQPELLFGEGGIGATAEAVKELEVKEIKITNPGSGYVKEKAGASPF